MKEVIDLIKKERRKPIRMLKLEALLRRLPAGHPARGKIEEELAGRMAGYKGEQAIDYYLRLLPSDRYLIFHGLRLPGMNDTYFQMDTLMVTSRFMVILEVKNMKGTLFFDEEAKQMIRTFDDVKEAYPHPMVQATIQKSQLQSWLHRHKLPRLPITAFVVISQPSTILQTSPEHKSIFRKMFHAASLPEKINGIDHSYQTDLLNPKELRQTVRLLLKEDSLENPDVLQQFQIDSSDILPGIQCPDCSMLLMTRKRGSWHCPHCQSTSKQAHIPALVDYALLLKSTITNQQMREFLGFSSMSTATKLLSSLKLPHTGTFSNRTYSLLDLINC